MYTRFMRNTTFEIVKMFLGSPQLAFKMYQIPMEHTVLEKRQKKVHSARLKQQMLQYKYTTTILLTASS